MVCSDRLKELFDYIPSTGRLKRKMIGVGEKSITQGVSPQGYYVRWVDKTPYLEHRLVWLYHHGVIPDEIDHANGVKTDNRIENLRVCDRGENNGNQRKRYPNGVASSHHKGVYFHRGSGKWVAQIVHHKTHYHLGCFCLEDDAALACKTASLMLFGKFAYLGRPTC